MELRAGPWQPRLRSSRTSGRDREDAGSPQIPDQKDGKAPELRDKKHGIAERVLYNPVQEENCTQNQGRPRNATHETTLRKTRSAGASPARPETIDRPTASPKMKSACQSRAGFVIPQPFSVGARPCLSGPLEPSARPGNGDRLVHHPLADAEVLVDPFRHLLVVTSYLVGFETGP